MTDISEWAKLRPDDDAIISSSGRRSFRELNANINRLARALRRRGLVAGDAVALLCTNRPEFAEVLFACQRSGLRLTPINWHLTVSEASYIVTDCEAKAIIAVPSLLVLARESRDQSPLCTVALVIGDATDGFDSYGEAIEFESADELDNPVPGSRMLYTSGTTGRPKGVFRPPAEASVLSNVVGYNDEGGDIHLCTGPLYHAAPLTFSLAMPLNFGATVVLMESWDAQRALELIEDHQITHTHMVPTMFHRLLSLPSDVRQRFNISSLRHVLHGAAPCPVPVKRRVIEWLGPVVWEYYAATEGLGSFVDSATWLERPGTVGRPWVPGQVIVGDEDANPLPAGEIGLIYLLAPGASRFQYFKDAEKTENAFRGDYFTLGDIGYLDDDGFLFLTDRSANLIISGGVNIYPAEVDAVLLEHPSVADAATIGVPNEEWGEEVLSVIELRTGIEESRELEIELIEFCRQHLAHFKCPRRVVFIDELPRQDNGKIYKRVLRERYR